jgi:hypothetical protein
MDDMEEPPTDAKWFAQNIRENLPSMRYQIVRTHIADNFGKRQRIYDLSAKTEYCATKREADIRTAFLNGRESR